jgi:hypothetical protein
MYSFVVILIGVFNDTVLGTKHILWNVWLVNETEWNGSGWGEAPDPETSHGW